MKTKINKQFNDEVRFIRPSKVKLSNRGHEVLVYLGPNIISLHRNFLEAILNPKKKLVWAQQKLLQESLGYGFAPSQLHPLLRQLLSFNR